MISADGQCDVVIIMPCLNEGKTIGACIDKANQWLRDGGVKGEIVVGDNLSRDESAEIAKMHGARVVSVATRGYGAAILAAIQDSRGQFIFIGDSDDTYDFRELEELFNQLKSGAGLVIGNRFLGKIEKDAMPWKNRYIGNPVLSWLGKRIFKVRIGDFHCGLRAIRRDVLQKLDLKSTGMELATEMVAKAALRGVVVREVPVTLRRGCKSRISHLRPWRDGFRHLFVIFMLSPVRVKFFLCFSLIVVGAFCTLTY